MEHRYLYFKFFLISETVEKFIYWICHKFGIGEAKKLIKNFQEDTHTFIDSIKQIKFVNSSIFSYFSISCYKLFFLFYIFIDNKITQIITPKIISHFLQEISSCNIKYEPIIVIIIELECIG